MKRLRRPGLINRLSISQPVLFILITWWGQSSMSLLLEKRLNWIRKDALQCILERYQCMTIADAALTSTLENFSKTGTIPSRKTGVSLKKAVKDLFPTSTVHCGAGMTG